MFNKAGQILKISSHLKAMTALKVSFSEGVRLDYMAIPNKSVLTWHEALCGIVIFGLRVL